MKAGRPKYHVRAKWITVTCPGGALMYYELNSKGGLTNHEKNLPVPNHFMESAPIPNKAIKNKIKEVKEKEETPPPSITEFENDINSLDKWSAFQAFEDTENDSFFDAAEDFESFGMFQ